MQSRSCIQRPFFKAQGNYWCVKLEEVLLGLALIPVLFYSYNGVFGKSPDWVNIAIFYVTAALVFSFERRAFKKSQQQCNYFGFNERQGHHKKVSVETCERKLHDFGGICGYG